MVCNVVINLYTWIWIQSLTFWMQYLRNIHFWPITTLNFGNWAWRFSYDFLQILIISASFSYKLFSYKKTCIAVFIDRWQWWTRCQFQKQRCIGCFFGLYCCRCYCYCCWIGLESEKVEESRSGDPNGGTVCGRCRHRTHRSWRTIGGPWWPSWYGSDEQGKAVRNV